MGEVIVVRGLGKQFKRYHPDRPRTFEQTFTRGLRRRKPVGRFWALRDVSFDLTAGEMVGVIGRNGSGKSTLLRLIGGVGRPDEGSVKVNGRIGALLELGAGFHLDLTGRENIFICGLVAGLTRREVEQRFDAIIAFAELEEFIDNPLRTYSSGMQMRLAFSVAVHTEPEILLIDEVLAVGDIAFQNKCLERINQFRANGCAMLFVSHDPTQIRQLCDKALWLRSGQVAAYGDPANVVEQYVAEMTQETKRRTPAELPIARTAFGTELRINENRLGSLEMEITNVHLLNQIGVPITEINSGEALRIEIEYHAPIPIDAPIFSATISDEREDSLFLDTSTAAAGLTLPILCGQGRISLQLERLDLNSGQYYIDVGVYEKNWAYAYDYHWHVYPLSVRAGGKSKGVLSPPHCWQLEKVSKSSLQECSIAR
jgi:lipopolysaccharide transport system ATP-binding protein